MKWRSIFLWKCCIVLLFKLTTAQLTSLITSVCPGDKAVFMCQELPTVPVRWTVSISGIRLENSISPSQVGSQMITFTNDPGYGFIMTLTTTASGNLNSTLQVDAVQALNGARVECAGTTLLLQIITNDPPDPPDVMMFSEMFQSGYVDVTIQLNNPISSNATYTVNVTPPIESSVEIGGASVQLTVTYNIRYSVRIVATNCAGNRSSNIIHLFYVDCGTPTTGNNVIIEGLIPPRVAQGTNVTFKCQSGQSYILTGPAAATCSSSGMWELDTSTVECIANCGQPIASRNVQVMYNSTLEGATVVFKCNEGFTPNVSHTGICQNNSMWYRDPADLVCVNPFGVDCGTPPPPADGSIISLTGTIEGSRVTFRCDDGLTQSLEMDAECQPDGNWKPNPAELSCTTTTMSTGGLSSASVSAIIVVLLIVFILSILFAVITTIVLIRRRNNSIKKIVKTPVMYSAIQHPGPRGNQTVVVQTDTLVYAGLDLPTSKNLSSFTDGDDTATGYADINFTAMSQSQNGTKSKRTNQETADTLLNLDSLLIQLKPEVTSKWEQFAQVIGLSKELIKDLSSCDPDDRMVEMLDYWLRHHPSKPTWRDVGQILEEIHLYQLADDLMKVYETGELPVPFDMNEVPEGTLPRSEPPPPLPPKIADLDDGPDLLTLTDLPPKPPPHKSRSSMRAPPPIPPAYHDNGGPVLPPSRPPKSHSHGAPPRPPKSDVDADVPARPPKPVLGHNKY